jgi:hypothetical protein
MKSVSDNYLLESEYILNKKGMPLPKTIYLYPGCPFFLIKPSNIHYCSGLCFVIFEIDCMFKNKYEIKMI